jgi:hypothetical protein
MTFVAYIIAIGKFYMHIQKIPAGIVYLLKMLF